VDERASGDRGVGTFACLAGLVSPQERSEAAAGRFQRAHCVGSATITALERGERCEVIRRGGSTGCMLKRRAFDRALAEAAAEAGAPVLTKTPVAGLLYEGRRRAGIGATLRGVMTLGS
jgi:flavin-dependent dehydrogenase